MFFENWQHLREAPNGLPGDSGPKTAAQIMGIAAIVLGAVILVYSCLKKSEGRDETVILLRDRGDRFVLMIACTLAAILSFFTLLVFASEGCYDKDCEPKELCSFDAPVGTYCYSKCHVSVGASASIIAGTLWLILGACILLWERKKPFRPAFDNTVNPQALKEGISLIDPS
ncbi:MAG: hypothetical protein SGARI_005065, partial [Bacillariaceae sp.]